MRFPRYYGGMTFTVSSRVLGRTVEEVFQDRETALEDYWAKQDIDRSGHFDDRFVVGVEDSAGKRIAPVPTLAIIPARGGSKRIPRKNLRLFHGKPIIAYSIEAALSSGCFGEVMVSTDDPEIAEVARQYGATVPFMRSVEAAGDHATTAEVIAEVVEAYGDRFGRACCLYPTSPFVTPDMLQEAARIMEATGAQSLMTVYEVPALRAMVMEGGRLRRILPQYETTRSQDLPASYYDAGQFYWIDVERFTETRALLGEDTVPMICDPSCVQDIDTEEDWRVAEAKFAAMMCPARSPQNASQTKRPAQQLCG